MKNITLSAQDIVIPPRDPSDMIEYPGDLEELNRTLSGDAGA